MEKKLKFFFYNYPVEPVTLIVPSQIHVIASGSKRLTNNLMISLLVHFKHFCCNIKVTSKLSL